MTTLLHLVTAAILVGTPYTPPGQAEATWYGPGYYGKPTASGAIMSQTHWGCAAPDYVPLGTVVHITRMDTGKSVTVPVTDRLGPTAPPDLWDMAYAVAVELDMIEVGRIQIQWGIVP